MRVVFGPLSLSLALLFSVPLISQVQQRSRIESMKLLTSDVGWAATNEKLFWTSNGGAKWINITPKLNHKWQSISSVFFLDASTGWVLLKCGDGSQSLADNKCFELASTNDTGTTWSLVNESIAVPFSKESIENGFGFSGRSWLDFVDAQHGWEILDIATNSANPSAGEMLRTVDGGKTWSPTKETPTSDHFRFVSAKDGWIAGGKDRELFVTRDAGDSWQKVSLPAIPGTHPNLGETYMLPVFETEKTGFLSVQYSVGQVAGPYLTTLVLLVTNDGGRTWKQDRILSRLPGEFTSEMADSFWVATHSELSDSSSTKTKLQLYTEGPDRSVTNNTAVVASDGLAVQLSFVSRDQGWINMSDRLLATTDSGRSWVDITPGAQLSAESNSNSNPSTTRWSKKTSVRNTAAGQPAPFESNPSAGSNVSTHLGFEAYNVPAATPTMSAWWSSSPFYDIGIYLQGAPNGHKDPILGSSNGSAWISAVQGQGWGLIPTWIGEQSPCACRYVKGQCVQYAYLFSADPSTDGAAEADAAIAAARSLSVTTPIIYKDIENYYGTSLCTAAQQTAAGLAVQAFVDGWDSELHLKGYLAGVYGNPKPAQNDFSIASTIPDDVWITKTPATGKPPQLTIWNLAPLQDKLWPNNQRLHQFLINQASATFGGQGLNEEMDDDLEDATIIAGNGTKAYSSQTFTSIDYPGAKQTWAQGINDMNVTSLISGKAQTGAIVGFYWDASYNIHGFLDQNGVMSSFDYPGAKYTWGTGTNNLGQIVGLWQDSAGNDHGFLKNGSSFSSIDYPGATMTQAFGINDAGQIVGWYYDAAGAQHGFLYYGTNGTKFYSIDYPGTTGVTAAFGINGLGSIAGAWTTSGNGNASFVEYTTPPTWTGSFLSYSDGTAVGTWGESINNDNSLGGYSERPISFTDYGFVIAPSNNDITYFLFPGAISTIVYGVNDYGQTVGFYQDSSNNYHGYLSVSQ